MHDSRIAWRIRIWTLVSELVATTTGSKSHPDSRSSDESRGDLIRSRRPLSIQKEVVDPEDLSLVDNEGDRPLVASIRCLAENLA